MAYSPRSATKLAAEHGPLPSRLCRAAGETTPRPAIDLRGFLDGVPGWRSEPRRSAQCTTIARGSISGTPKDVDTIDTLDLLLHYCHKIHTLSPCMFQRAVTRHQWEGFVTNRVATVLVARNSLFREGLLLILSTTAFRSLQSRRNDR